MTDTDDSTVSRSWGKYISYGVIALVLYVLSMGPAVWLDERGMIGPAYHTIYFPLYFIFNDSFLEEPIRWYVNLWR